MKEVFRKGFLGGALVVLLSISACQDPCAGLTDDEIGGEYFTVTYQDATGRNLLEEVWDERNVLVWIDSSGGQGSLDLYRLPNSFANGVFGPFQYTEAFTDVATLEVNRDFLNGQEMRFDYYIKKDTFGIDTFTLTYLLLSDECRFFWSEISYQLNGETLGSYTGQRQAEIVLVE